MLLSKVPMDGRAIVPAEVLAALGLNPGDDIAFVIDAYGQVTVGRTDDPFVNPFATFTEWASDADREAYADL